jgi:hypothetical protein
MYTTTSLSWTHSGDHQTDATTTTKKKKRRTREENTDTRGESFRCIDGTGFFHQGKAYAGAIV